MTIQQQQNENGNNNGDLRRKQNGLYHIHCARYSNWSVDLKGVVMIWWYRMLIRYDLMKPTWPSSAISRVSSRLPMSVIVSSAMSVMFEKIPSNSWLVVRSNWNFDDYLIAECKKPHLLYLFPEHFGDHVEISEVGLLWQDKVFDHLLVGHSTFASSPSWYAWQIEQACFNSVLTNIKIDYIWFSLYSQEHNACSTVLKFNTSFALSSNFAFDYRTKQQIASEEDAL